MADDNETTYIPLDAYSNDEEELKYAISEVEEINAALQRREVASDVFNGLEYSESYKYNVRKGINYSPKKSEDDEQVSMGLIHEKIVSFCAIFLRYAFKRKTTCYDNMGGIIEGLGTIYDLAIEHSYRVERFKRKIGLFLWEMMTQEGAWIFEGMEIKNIQQMDAYDSKKKKVTADSREFTLEYLDGLTYKKGKMVQTRMAKSTLLDGRSVILDNMEIEDVQEQSSIAIEFEYSRVKAEQIFGSLKRWKYVPKSREDFTAMFDSKVTLFDASRLSDPDKKVLVHYRFSKDANRYNVYVNGLMMLSRDTTMRVFYPRGNYPLTHMTGERLSGSAYARSVPAKTKFTDDFLNWAFKTMAYKFEQGATPAILTKGKLTISKKMFKGGQVTHGISREDFEKADPDNKGVQPAEFSFVDMLKESIEQQTANPTTSGEVEASATAFAISKADQNQREKLGYLLDGIVQGFVDLFLRRAETIESRYTLKRDETVVDGKKIAIYQDFTVSMDGEDSIVQFNDEMNAPEFSPERVEEERNRLFTRSFEDRKKGRPKNRHMVNPLLMRQGNYMIDSCITPERINDSQIQVIQFWDEMEKITAGFGGIDKKVLKQEYSKVSSRNPDLIPAALLENNLPPEMEVQNTGSMAKPTVKSTSESV